jgi:hypothetical protein
MGMRHAIVLLGVIGFITDARAQDFRIDEVSSARDTDVAQLKPGTIVFSDRTGADAAGGGAILVPFVDWTHNLPNQKKFLSLFPAYTEPTIVKPEKAGAKPGVPAKLYMYVGQARFVLDRPPGAIDLSHYVTLDFLQKIDPAIKHKVTTAADLPPPKGDAAAGNENPDRKWCTGRANSICIESTYKMEGKIPIGILLVNKLRDSAKKVSDRIDFESELSALAPTDVDQAGLQELTTLNTPVGGVLEQNIFHVNEILRFGKFLAVFQGHPSDPGKTIVTAFMALAINADVLDKKREFDKVPVLHNLVPEQVLMGQSSFNSGNSISAGLPKYARNEIKTVAGILEHDAK